MTREQLQALQWAVSTAAETRGALTGGPPEELTEFDDLLRVAQEALNEILERRGLQ
jgi:hypothetical protein